MSVSVCDDSKMWTSSRIFILYVYVMLTSVDISDVVTPRLGAHQNLQDKNQTLQNLMLPSL